MCFTESPWAPSPIPLQTILLTFTSTESTPPVISVTTVQGRRRNDHFYGLFIPEECAFIPPHLVLSLTVPGAECVSPRADHVHCAQRTAFTRQRLKGAAHSSSRLLLPKAGVRMTAPPQRDAGPFVSRFDGQGHPHRHRNEALKGLVA